MKFYEIRTVCDKTIFRVGNLRAASRSLCSTTKAADVTPFSDEGDAALCEVHRALLLLIIILLLLIRTNTYHHAEAYPCVPP